MEMNSQRRSPALVALDVLLGEWGVEASIPSIGPTPLEGRMLFEWDLDGQFLMQRSTISDPGAPDSVAVIGPDPATEGYLQHYFDSRGVVRLYAMNLKNGVWSLIRNTPDFSELKFWQRFTARFSEDGDTITGAWEMSQDGAHWDHDLDLIYRRVR
jgi:hypothetical protein